MKEILKSNFFYFLFIYFFTVFIGSEGVRFSFQGVRTAPGVIFELCSVDDDSFRSRGGRIVDCEVLLATK